MDFKDFQLRKKRQHGNKTLSDYKEKIRSLTTWSEEDLKIFDEN